jgi:long-chain acyl-CoA synthetase
MSKKIEPKPLTIQSLINYSIQHFADKPSISFVDSEPITYADLGKKIDEVSAMLFSLGLEKGDKVALLSNNMPNWVVAYFAVVGRGLIIVPILPDFSREEIENVLSHSESKALFVSERLLSRVEGLELPHLKATFIVDDLSLQNGKIDATAKTKPEIVSDEDDIAAIIYTSGTTGRSKGVVLTHKIYCFCGNAIVYISGY